MLLNYRLELRDIQGVPCNCGPLVLEVIVRTTRLLRTSKQSYASEPFHPGAVLRGVAVHWTQAKGGKAFLRLRFPPALTGQDAAVLELPEGAGKQASVPLRVEEEGLQVAQLPLPLPTLPGPQGRGEPASAGGEPSLPSVEVAFLVHKATDGRRPTAVPGAAAAAGVPSSSYAWAEPAAEPLLPAPTPSSLPLAPPTARKRSWLFALGLGRSGAPPAAAFPATAPANGHGRGGGGPHGTVAFGGGGSSKPALSGTGADAPGTVMGLAAAASGIVSAGGFGVDGVAASGHGLGGAPQLAAAGGAAGWIGTEAGQQRLTERVPGERLSSHATGHGRGRGRFTLPNAMSSGGGGGGGFAAQQAALAMQPAVAPGPPQPPAHALVSPFGTLAYASAGGPDGRERDAAAQPISLAAGASGPLPRLSSTPASAPASSLSELQTQPPKRRRLGDLLARIFSPAGLNPAHRTGSGDVTAAAAACPSLALPSTALPPTAGAATGPDTGATKASTLPPPPAAAAATAAGAVLAQQPRRAASGLGLTPLVPPSPRLGDVYRVQDVVVASDRGVQLGFGPGFGPGNLGGSRACSLTGLAVGAGAGAGAFVNGGSGSGAAGSGIGGAAGSSGGGDAGVPLPAGLDSPGYGELSPAGGPDRLTIEPPVGDMAALAASSPTPMDTSPGQPPAGGGCFFWRVGAAARARAAEQAKAAVVPPAPPCAAAAASGAAAGAAATASGASSVAQAQAQAKGQCGAASEQPGGGSGDHRGPHGAAHDGEVPAAPCPSQQPLEAEIGRVMGFIKGQSGLSDEQRGVSLSQCQFLLDCLRKPDMSWIVGDSLLQLKREVGFPFDTGVPIPGAPGWFRLVLQPLQLAVPPPPPAPQPPPQDAQADAQGNAESSAAGTVLDLTGACAPAASEPPPRPAAAAAAAAALPPPPPEVLKVRWARFDQRQCGGANACAAIVLEVAAFCLAAVHRWRSGSNAAAAAAGVACAGAGAGAGSSCRRHSGSFGRHADGGGGGGTSRRGELPPLLRRSLRERGGGGGAAAAAEVEMEAMSGAQLEDCIRTGTEVWQGLLLQSPAARLASGTGDFDLEHMCRLGGYGDRLLMAEYTAASLLETAFSGGGGGGAGAGAGGWGESNSGNARASLDRRSGGGSAGSLGVAPEPQHHSSPAASLLFPSLPLDTKPPHPHRSQPHPHQPQPQPQDGRNGGQLTQPCGEPAAPSARPPRPPPLQLGAQAAASNEGPPTLRARHSWQGGVPLFASLVRKLTEGVYVLGCHGHFTTLWLRPGGVVHLIDSLGARLAADCPLAFVLEFDSLPEFLDFFLSRHQARRDAAAADDIAGGNMAALVEVHRLELQQLKGR